MSRKQDTNTLDLFRSTQVPNPQVSTTLPTVEIFFDGGCSPNPGSKYGSFEVVIDGRKVHGLYRVKFGYGTNNEAEWNALELAVEHAHAWLVLQGLMPDQFHLRVETDSKIVHHRLMRKNKVHRKVKWREASERMFNLAEACLVWMRKFGAFTVDWRKREANMQRFGH